MKILQVITAIPKAAGTSVFCGELANGLAELGHDVTIAVVNPNTLDQYPLDSRVKLISLSSILTTIASTTEDYDVVHIHGIWSLALHKISKWAIKNNIPIVWSPHGMLQKWAIKNKWWKKIVALALYQWSDLVKASLLHATAESEVEDIRRLGLRNKVVLAPLGVRTELGISSHELRTGIKKTLLFVSRVQKKKGLPVLIEAWATLPSDIRKCWQVRIVGPDQDNHIAELKLQCERLNVSKDFIFTGPKYGCDLDEEYSTAHLFVLPTHSENFGSVVIEALSRGIPVICSQGAPWKDLLEYRCGWWPKDSVDALTDALVDAMQCSDAERIQMGRRGRMLVAEKYTWDAVCSAILRGYKEILNV